MTNDLKCECNSCYSGAPECCENGQVWLSEVNSLRKKLAARAERRSTALEEGDLDWLRFQRDNGHCGERSMEQAFRDRFNARIDRILQALGEK